MCLFENHSHGHSLSSMAEKQSTGAAALLISMDANVATNTSATNIVLGCVLALLGTNVSVGS